MRRRRAYPWPASKLDPALMHNLHLVAVETGTPITRAVREAVVAYLVQRGAEVDAAAAVQAVAVAHPVTGTPTPTCTTSTTDNDLQVATQRAPA
jgi:hypothetical protein